MTPYKLHGVQIDVDLFVPHYTPMQMLELGVFGGGYFHRATEVDLVGMGLDDLWMLVERDRRPPLYKRNAYGVKAGMSFHDWMERGWIFPEDPLGWFHWYCRWYAGRRHARDNHQKARWVSYGERWGRTARGNFLLTGYVSPVVKQGLLQWAYNPMFVTEQQT